MTIDKQTLIIEYAKSIESRNASLFIGAGFSVASGYYDWSKLLKEPAKNLKLDIEKEKHDLTTLAQLYVNKNNRTSLEDILLDEFGKIKEISKNHELLSRLPIQTIWTTNYDKLIETAFRNENKICDIKHDDKQLKSALPNRDLVIYKMHGDIDHVNELIITRDDYLYFDKKHELFREILEAELVSKTFLFIGFSFSDPNLQSILGKLRILLDGKPRNHFCILRSINKEECLINRQDYDYLKIKQDYLIEDLKRYGILVCLIDSYNEITEILTEIELINRRKSIFISGSAVIYEPFSETTGKYFIQELARRLSKSQRKYRIINGYGKGIGEYLINGVVEAKFEKSEKQSLDQITVLPFPTHEKANSKKREIYSKYRQTMIERTGIALFIFGNKEDSKNNGVIVNSTGMKEELELSIKNGVVPLVIGSTGYMSQELYNQLINGHYCVPKDINYETAQKLCNDNNGLNFKTKKDVDKLISRIIKAIDILNKHESEGN